MGHKRWAKHTPKFGSTCDMQKIVKFSKKIKNRFTPTQIKPKPNYVYFSKNKILPLRALFPVFSPIVLISQGPYFKSTSFDLPTWGYRIRLWVFLKVFRYNVQEYCFQPIFSKVFWKDRCFFNTYFNPSLHC